MNTALHREIVEAAEALGATDLLETPLVYVIQGEGGGPVKVGKSTFRRLPHRVAEIQTGHPSALRVVSTFRGGLAIERMLHRALSRHRIRGEWFSEKCLPTIAEFQAATGGDARAAVCAAMGAACYAHADELEKFGRERLRAA